MSEIFLMLGFAVAGGIVIRLAYEMFIEEEWLLLATLLCGVFLMLGVVTH